MNPCQALGTAVAATALGANKSRYIADQTVAFEAVSNSLSYAFSSVTGLTVSTTSASQFAIIQYLEGSVAQQLLQGKMAVQLRGHMTGAALTGYVNIYWTTGSPLPDLNTPNLNSLVATMTSGQPATFNQAGGQVWTAVPRGNLGSAVFSMPLTTDEVFNFNGFDATAVAGISTATYVAIVISFAEMPTTSTAVIKYCTLCKGDIATPPPAMNQAEVLYGLQYYYQKSFDTNVKPGTTSPPDLLGPRMAVMSYYTSGADTVWGIAPFELLLNTEMRHTPNVKFYNMAGVIDNLQRRLYTSGSTSATDDVFAPSSWTAFQAGTKNIIYVPNSNNTTFNVLGSVAPARSAAIFYHFVADSRLGIVAA